MFSAAVLSQTLLRPGPAVPGEGLTRYAAASGGWGGAWAQRSEAFSGWDTCSFWLLATSPPTTMQCLWMLLPLLCLQGPCGCSADGSVLGEQGARPCWGTQSCKDGIFNLRLNAGQPGQAVQGRVIAVQVHTAGTEP